MSISQNAIQRAESIISAASYDERLRAWASTHRAALYDVVNRAELPISEALIRNAVKRARGAEDALRFTYEHGEGVSEEQKTVAKEARQAVTYELNGKCWVQGGPKVRGEDMMRLAAVTNNAVAVDKALARGATSAPVSREPKPPKAPKAKVHVEEEAAKPSIASVHIHDPGFAEEVENWRKFGVEYLKRYLAAKNPKWASSKAGAPGVAFTIKGYPVEDARLMWAEVPRKGRMADSLRRDDIAHATTMQRYVTNGHFAIPVPEIPEAFRAQGTDLSDGLFDLISDIMRSRSTPVTLVRVPVLAAFLAAQALEKPYKSAVSGKMVKPVVRALAHFSNNSIADPIYVGVALAADPVAREWNQEHILKPLVRGDGSSGYAIVMPKDGSK